MMSVQYKKLGVWVTLFLLVSLTRYSHATPFDQIDQHARNAPTRVTGDVEALTAYLVRPATNDLQKVRSFYVWIAENIAYDVGAFLHYNPNRYQKVLPNEVLKQRKAVCQGYAELFLAMCQISGIPCYLVPGYSKSINAGDRDFTSADHAWNAVKIDEQWHLLDVTWGSGGLTNQLKFVKEFNEKYFLSDPSTFIQDHMPLDPMWQLLDCPVRMTSFVSGEAAVQQDVAVSAADCREPRVRISTFEQLDANEKDLVSAQRAYAFNPANPWVLVHAYMNQAHHLMSSIPQQLRSRDAIEEALQVQEKAMTYLQKAQQVAASTKKREGEQLKNLLKANIENAENNLKGLRKALF